MESNDECTFNGGCAADVNNPSPGGCDNCWDFLDVQFFIDGVQVGGDLIGDAGTTDAEQSGTILLDYCTNGTANTASIEIRTQTWASTETVTFSNVTITCVENYPTIAPIGPFCETDGPQPLDPSPDGFNGTWSGLGVSGTTFTPSAVGAGTYDLTFTPFPAECSGPVTTTVTVNPASTPTLTPIGPFCADDPPVTLNTVQDGISGSWSGPGVSGNIFDPSMANIGSNTLLFTPDPGECANEASLIVQVNNNTPPTLDAFGPYCETDPAVFLNTVQDGVTGSWSGPGVSGGDTFTPAAAGPGSAVLSFNPDPGQCAATATTSIQVNAAVTPAPSPQGPYCETDPAADLPTTVSGVNGTWMGPGVSGGDTFTPGAANIGSNTLTFTPDAGECATTATLDIQVNAASPPALDPLGPYCENASAVSLPSMQDGVNGSWSGPGVSGGNTFTPAAAGPGTTVLTFMPDPGQCATDATLSVQVNAAVTPMLDPQGPFCETGMPVNLPPRRTASAAVGPATASPLIPLILPRWGRARRC